MHIVCMFVCCHGDNIIIDNGIYIDWFKGQTVVPLVLVCVSGEGAVGRWGDGGWENWENCEDGDDEGEGVRGDMVDDVTERRADSCVGCDGGS